LTGDADSQGLGRRRRRRGSRRRSERVGLPGEGPLGAEGGFEAEADADGSEELTGFDERDVVGGGEQSEENAVPPYVATTEPEINNIADLAPEDLAALEAEVELPEAVVTAPVAEVAPPVIAPRDRRRRTRRPAAAVQEPLPAASEPVLDALIPSDADPGLPATNGTDLVVDPEAPPQPSAELISAEAEAAPAPVRRTRRRTTGPTATGSRATET
jgi:hypothetical protein